MEANDILRFLDKIDIKNLSFKNIDFSNDIEIKTFIKNLKSIFENYY